MWAAKVLPSLGASHGDVGGESCRPTVSASRKATMLEPLAPHHARVCAHSRVVQ